MRCTYCRSESESDFCNIECEVKYKKYISKEKKYASIALILIFLPLVLLFFIIIDPQNTYAYVGLVILLEGIVFMIFPFATPETITAIGVKRSVQMVRGISLICIVVGTLLLYRSF